MFINSQRSVQNPYIRYLVHTMQGFEFTNDNDPQSVSVLEKNWCLQRISEPTLRDQRLSTN